MDTQIRSQRQKALVPWLLGIMVVVLVCTIVLFVILRQSLTMPQPAARTPPIAEKSPHLDHPIFGEAHKAVALDVRPPPAAALSALGHLMVKLGLGTPPRRAPTATRTSLFIGQTPMLWSAGGYLYCDLLSSAQPLWQFAPCNKTNLSELMPQDFLTTFAAMGDKTNGLAAFGTNWLKHAIRVRQGQVILARLVSDPAQVYALEIAAQNMTNAVVYYLKKPL